MVVILHGVSGGDDHVHDLPLLASHAADVETNLLGFLPQGFQ